MTSLSLSLWNGKMKFGLIRSGGIHVIEEFHLPRSGVK